MEIEELKRKLDVSRAEMVGSQRTVAALQAQIQADKTTIAKMTSAIDDLDLAGREQLAAFNRSIAEIQSLKSQLVETASIKSQVALLTEQLLRANNEMIEARNIQQAHISEQQMYATRMEELEKELSANRAKLRDAEAAQSSLAANVREGKVDCPVDFTGTGRAGGLTSYTSYLQLFLICTPMLNIYQPLSIGKVSSERRTISEVKGGGRLMSEVVPGELPEAAALRMGYERRFAELETINRQASQTISAQSAAADRMDLEVARALHELAQLQAAYAETSAQLQQARKDSERIDGEKALLEANYLLKLKLLVQVSEYTHCLFE